MQLRHSDGPSGRGRGLCPSRQQRASRAIDIPFSARCTLGLPPWVPLSDIPPSVPLAGLACVWAKCSLALRTGLPPEPVREILVLGESSLSPQYVPSTAVSGSQWMGTGVSPALGTHSCRAERVVGQQSFRPCLSPMQSSLELTTRMGAHPLHALRAQGGPGRGVASWVLSPL